MARVSLQISDSLVAIALSGAVVLIHETDSAVKPLLLLPSSEAAESTTSTGPSSDVVSMSFCADRSKLVVIYNDKSVRTWNCFDGSEIAKQKLPKKLASVAMAPLPNEIEESCGSEVVLVGDKTGDVYALSFPDLSKKKLMLGHTASIITSIGLIPPTSSLNHSLIATADRDEKIRLSHWPQTGLIHAYCLGHLDYISSISTIPNKPLVSLSGDGTLRVWNPLNGKCLAIYHIDNGDESDEKGEDSGDKEKLEEGGGGVPICMARLCNHSHLPHITSNDIVVLAISNSKKLLFFDLSHILLDNTQSINLIPNQMISLNQMPCNLCFSDNTGELIIQYEMKPHVNTLQPVPPPPPPPSSSSRNENLYEIMNKTCHISLQVECILQEHPELKILSPLSLDDNELKDNLCIVDVGDSSSSKSGVAVGDFVPGVNELRKRVVERPCHDWNSKKRLNWQGNKVDKGND